jgi:hypothetical protein
MPTADGNAQDQPSGIIRNRDDIPKEVYLMPHPRFSGEEIARRGDALYEEKLRPVVETDENIGKIISIDIETGAYEIGEDPVATGRCLQARHADAAIWTKRIGYNAVYALGGSLTRTVQ